MTPMNNVDHYIQRKLRVLRHAEHIGDVSKTCRYFGIGRASFCRWRAAFQRQGEAGLVKAQTRAEEPRQPDASGDHREGPTSAADLPTSHLGPIRIVWYLARYHDIKISDAGVYRILRRNGLNRLLRGTRVRKIHTQRYEQKVPGHQIQVDVKFLIFQGKDGKTIKRYQYTAIDDAPRVRALKVYDRHTQANAIAFIDHVLARFPFRIREGRTEF